MTYSNSQIIDWMASDLSQNIEHFAPDWPYPDVPADGYTDVVRTVFGQTSTRESIIAAYQSGYAVPALQKALNEYFETSVITLDIATKLVRQAIFNNFGFDAIV